jgi:hypothetical protein
VTYQLKSQTLVWSKLYKNWDITFFPTSSEFALEFFILTM